MANSKTTINQHCLGAYRAPDTEKNTRWWKNGVCPLIGSTSLHLIKNPSNVNRRRKVESRASEGNRSLGTTWMMQRKASGPSGERSRLEMRLGEETS